MSVAVKKKKPPASRAAKPKKRLRKSPGETSADRERWRKNEYILQATRDRNEVAYIPRAKKWDKLHRACRHNLRLWLTEVFPDTTGLKPFGDHQLQAIDTTQQVILRGGRFVDAEPRAYCKTIRCAHAALWALLYGHRRCIPLFGCNQEKAQELLMKIRVPLTSNPVIRGMWPTLAACVKAVNENPHKCRYQLSSGKRTGIQWKAGRVVLPTIRNKPYSGGSLCVLPIKSARGVNLTNEVTGDSLRPDFFFLDDIQTDEVADSDVRVNRTVDLIRSVVLRLGGLSYTLSGVMTATCIKPSDVTEQFLDDPSWQSLRVSHLITRSENEAMWLGPYAELRRGYVADDPASQHAAWTKATAYYRDHRAEMDKGAQSAWEWAYAFADNPQVEISAIQRAYNVLIDDGQKVFDAEVQNRPARISSLAEKRLLTVREICEKQRVDDYGVVPPNAHTVVAGIDVQERAAYWVVSAFGDFFTGGPIAYGVFPEQPVLGKYSLIATTLQDLWPDQKIDAQIYLGLDTLVDQLCAVTWKRDSDGIEFPISRICIDRGYKTSAVDMVVRQSRHAGILTAAKGVGVGAADTPFEDRKLTEGEKAGNNYQIRRVKNDSRIMYALVDSNYWKTQLHEGLRTGFGDKGCLSLFNVVNAADHEFIATNYRAEYPTETFGRGRKVEEWQMKPERPDNHLLDASCLAMVAASMEGIKFEHESPAVPAKRRVARRIKLSERMQRK